MSHHVTVRQPVSVQGGLPVQSDLNKLYTNIIRWCRANGGIKIEESELDMAACIDIESGYGLATIDIKVNCTLPEAIMFNLRWMG